MHDISNMPNLLVLIVVLACSLVALHIVAGQTKTGSRRKKFVVRDGVYEHSAESGPRGVEEEEECPEIQRLDALVDFFETTRDWGVLVEVGDMYARGCFPFYCADPSTAIKVYAVASRCPDAIVSTRAMSRYSDTRTNPISSSLDSLGRPFPAATALRLVESADYQIKRAPFRVFTKNRRPPVPEPVAVVADTVVAPKRLVLDKQNVHDHAVSTAIKQNVKQIVEGVDEEYDRVELIDSVMDELRGTNQLSDQKMCDAFRVLVSLVPDKIESVGCSQIDVLNATIKKINGVKQSCLRSNLYETLGKNLASGVERGLVVCSTGKIGRIISTLEGTDLVAQKAVPIEVVRNEIATLASKVRDDVLSEVSKTDVECYNSSSVHTLSSKMRSRFEELVKTTYVDGLGLSSKVLDPVVKMYSSEF